MAAVDVSRIQLQVVTPPAVAVSHIQAATSGVSPKVSIAHVQVSTSGGIPLIFLYRWDGTSLAPVRNFQWDGTSLVPLTALPA